MVTVWSQFVLWVYGARQRYEPNFLCANPLTVLRVFLDASRHSAFTHVVFFQKKVNIDENIRGESFVHFQMVPLERPPPMTNRWPWPTIFIFVWKTLSIGSRLGLDQPLRGVHPRHPAVHYGWNSQVCWTTTQSLGPCHFQTVAAVFSAVYGAFLDENGWLWTIWDPIWDHHLGEERLRNGSN